MPDTFSESRLPDISAHDSPQPTGWTVKFSADIPLGGNPYALLQRLADISESMYCDASARADFAWDDPLALEHWGASQASASLADTYQTALLALASNVNAIDSFRQSLAWLLSEKAVCLEALCFLSTELHDGLKRRARLVTLATTLLRMGSQRNLVLPPLPTDISLPGASEAVIERFDASLTSSPTLMGEQMLQAMSSATGLGGIPADGRAPYEEIQALFVVEPQGATTNVR